MALRSSSILSRASILQRVSKFALAIYMSFIANSAVAQNSLQNGGFESGPTAVGETWVTGSQIPGWGVLFGGVSYGKSFWSPTFQGESAIYLFAGGSIFQGGVGFIPATPHLLVVSAAGKPTSGPRDAPLQVTSSSLRCKAERNFTVKTTTPPLRWRTLVWPFELCVSGIGSASIMLRSDDGEGLVVDDVYLIPLNPGKPVAGFSALNDSPITGGLAELQANDNAFLGLKSSSMFRSGLLVVGYTDIKNPAKLSFNVAARRLPGGRVTFDALLYDFVNQQWVSEATTQNTIGRELGVQKAILSFNKWQDSLTLPRVEVPLANFVDPSGLVLGRIMFSPFTGSRFPPPPPAPFEVQVDQAAFTIQ